MIDIRAEKSRTPAHEMQGIKIDSRRVVAFKITWPTTCFLAASSHAACHTIYSKMLHCT